jgi:RHS repeat-associated protein
MFGFKMPKFKTKSWISIALPISIMLPNSGLSQEDIDIDLNYDYSLQEKFKVNYEPEAHTPNLMGEVFDPSTGTIKFQAVDIDIPGNSALRVQLRRMHDFVKTGRDQIPGRRNGVSGHTTAFRFLGTDTNWYFDTPRLMYLASEDEAYQPVGIQNGEYCTGTFAVSQVLRQESGMPLFTRDYNTGYDLIVPGEISDSLIQNNESLVGSEEATFVTKSKWKVNCKTSGSNEFFEATSPAGITYTFDRLVQVDNVESIVTGSRSGRFGAFVFFATKVEDRFGNWVRYEYDNNELSRIHSNDGRDITVSRTDDGAEATTNGRVWKYKQNGNRVELPDGRFWQYSFSREEVTVDSVSSSDQSDTAARCNVNSPLTRFDPHFSTIGTNHLENYPYTDVDEQFKIGGQYIEVTHPDGAIGKFWTGLSLQGRTNVQPEIIRFTGGFPASSFSTISKSRCLVQPSLVKKSIEYNDGKEYEWHYQHSNNWGSYVPNDGRQAISSERAAAELKDVELNSSIYIPANIDNYNYKVLKIINPDLSYILQYINRDYDSHLENKVIAEVFYSSNHRVLKEVLADYEIGTIWGTSPNGLVFSPDKRKASFYTPRLTNAETILVDDTGAKTTYKNTYENFDGYDVPQNISLFNDIISGQSRYFKREYYNDVDNWVLSQPQKTYLKSTPITSTAGLIPLMEYVYHSESTNAEYAGKSLVYQEKRFGQWVKRHQSYHDDGNVNRTEYNKRLRSSVTAFDTNYRYVERTQYKRGQPQNIKYPARYSTAGTISQTQVVNSDGWVTSITDFNGNAVGYTYNKMGRVISIDAPSSSDNTWLDTFFEWDYSSGKLVLTKSQCPLNGTKTACSGAATYQVKTQYDGMLRPILEERKDVGNSVSRYQNMAHSWDNKIAFQSFWSDFATESEGTHYYYDGLQRLSRTAFNDNTEQTVAYLSGNKMQVTDARGNTMTTEYLAYGSPSYETATKVESPISSTETVDTEISLNLYGNAIAISQTGQDKDGNRKTYTEHRVYDSNQFLCKVVRPDVGVSVFENNVLGEVTSRAQGVTGSSNNSCSATIAANKRVSLSYDNLGENWITNFADADTPDVSYLHDNNGNVLELKSGSVTHTYAYNNLNLLTSEKLSLSQKTMDLTYGFNNQGYVDSLTYPDGYSVIFSSNAFGEATGVERLPSSPGGEYTYADKATYHANGLLKSFDYGNGVTYNSQLNNRNVVKSIEDKLNTNLINSLNYSFDGNLNVTSIIDGVNGDYSLTSLSYDQLNRLTKSEGGVNVGDSTITYDGFGNILTYDNDQQKLVYDYNNQNQLTSVNKVDAPTVTNYRFFTYDDRGNVEGNGLSGFEFNEANQLQTSGNNTYLYDGHSRRVRQTDSKGISYSMYSQSGILLYRETEAGGINYIYLGDRLVAKDGIIPEKAGDQHFYPYGSGVEDEIDDIGYAGHKFDTDLGLSYMQSRYYDPMIGRFYSNDPVGYTPENPVMSFNRYLYVNNNPYRYVDPDGEALKLAKALFNVAKNTFKNKGDIRKASKDELLGVVENVAELIDGDFTQDDIFAAVDLLTGFGKEAKNFLGKQNRQQRLKDLLNDPKVSSADKGWIKQEMNEVKRGKKGHLRNPPFKDLAHERGRENKKGFGFEHANLQNRKDHKTQHKLDDKGRKNKERGEIE